MSNRAPGRAAAAAVALLLFVAATPRQLAKQDVEGIRNFTRVDATVACAGATSVEAIAGLKREGFVSIINLRQASERGVDIEASRGPTSRCSCTADRPTASARCGSSSA